LESEVRDDDDHASLGSEVRDDGDVQQAENDVRRGDDAHVDGSDLFEASGGDDGDVDALDQ